MRYIFLLLISFSFSLAQKTDGVAVDPCNHPLLKLAKTKGIKAVPIKDLIRFERLMKACERAGGKEQIKDMYSDDWKRDYKKAKTMASWTSTHAMCVFVSFIYFFAGKALATVP